MAVIKNSPPFTPARHLPLVYENYVRDPAFDGPIIFRVKTRDILNITCTQLELKPKQYLTSILEQPMPKVLPYSLLFNEN